MATDAQIRANQSNAQLSTGPRTAEGKAVSSRNPLKHALSCERVLLPDEDPEEMLLLYVTLRRDLDPRGSVEEMFFDRIVAATWRLRRAHLVECGLFERCLDPYGRPEQKGSLTQMLKQKFEKSCKSADALGKLSRYENSIERSLHRSLTELRRLQEERREEAESKEEKLRNEPNSVVTPDGDKVNAPQGL